MQQELALTIKIVYSSSRGVSEGQTFQARTADLSDGGLRLRLMTAVAAGTELEMWVISPVQRETLVINGAVRWCQPVQGDATIHEAGVEIARRPTTDFLKWQKMAAGLAGA